MIKILLIDDSLTIQKVVRLTFQDAQEYQVKICTRVSDAQDLFKSFRPDVCLVYARIAGNITAEFFDTFRQQCANIILLAERDEDLGVLQDAGYVLILRKPFLSEELRKIVATASKSAPTSGQPIAAKPQIPVTPMFGFNDEPTLAGRSIFGSDGPTTPSTPPQPTRFAPTVVKPIAEPDPDPFDLTLSLFENDSAEIPEVTMDIRSLENAYHQSLSKHKPPTPAPPSIEVFSDTKTSVPMEIEDVVVRTKPVPDIPANHPVRTAAAASQFDIQEAVDMAMARALDKLVPSKIEAKLAVEWDRILSDVCNRLRDEALAQVKTALQLEIPSLKIQALNHFGNVTQTEFQSLLKNWIEREGVDLTIDVVKKEIRTLLEAG